jgi:hypothetical protein
MTIRKLGWTLFVIALLVSLPAVGLATDKATPGTCSLATLKGTYGVWEQGTIVGQLPSLPPPPFPWASSALPTYDGAGSFSGSFTASFDGAIVPGTFTGKYQVNADCTYSDQFTPLPGLVIQHKGTITGRGMFQGINYIHTEAGVVASGTFKKTPAWGCSLATLHGTYAVFGQGTDIAVTLPGLPAPPFPWADGGGIITFDGKGNFSGQTTEDADGVTIPDTFTGTYTVNPDCTTSAVINTSLGLVLHETGTITGVDESKEVHNIMTDAGWVYAETLKKQ